MSETEGFAFRCRLYGLDVASQVDLHVQRSAAAGRPDVRVVLGPTVRAGAAVPAGELVAQWSTSSGLTASFVRRDDGSHLLRFESTCDVVVDAGGETVTVHMVDGVPDAMGGVLVAGTVLSFLLMLRDEVVLHASAVDVGGRAIGFVGSSGMGKSTMATVLCRDGGLLITDDVLRVRREPGGPYGCSLGATELRLRVAASSLTGAVADDSLQRPTADGRQALAVRRASQDDVPLTALVIPRPDRDSSTVRLTRLPPAAAALTLVGFPRILGIRDQRMLATQLLQMAELAEHVPLFLADVPWGPPFDPGLAGALLDVLEAEVGRPRPAVSRRTTDRDTGARC